MLDFWLKSLRGRLIILALVMVTIPILVAGYSMKKSAAQSLLDEKRGKLLAMGAILDSRLGPGGFAGVLERQGMAAASREDTIRALSRELAAVCDEVAASSPGLGAGLYSKELDAIITYAPSGVFGHTVGLSIGETHPGRQVMQHGEVRVEFGTLVRGDIMNAMRPLVRGGQVIGYVFTNELNDDINAQLAAMDRGVRTSMAVGLALGVALILLMTHGLVRDVNTIVQGLKDMRFGLAKPIKPLKGELGEIAATVNDMAAALADARTLSEDIMESVAEGIVALDTAGKITAFNRAAARLTGLAPRDVLGLGVSTVFAGVNALQAMLTATLRTGDASGPSEMAFPRAWGSLWLNVSTSVLKNQAGQVIGAAAVINDLTERKLLEQQVNQADRLATLGELMAGVAHEIRNPLTSIKGFLQYFQSAGTEEERQKYLPLLLGEVERMNRIIESLLFFSRPGQTMDAQVDLERLLGDTFILVQSRARKQGVTLKAEVEENLPPVVLDSQQFQQVFLNLAVNSLQAMVHGGELTVKAKSLGERELEVSFCDTGPGIPASLRAQVFDPFFTTKETGTGLGLSVVRRILEARGGRILIEDNPDGGACIRIVMPRIASYLGE